MYFVPQPLFLGDIFIDNFAQQKIDDSFFFLIPYVMFQSTIFLILKILCIMIFVVLKLFMMKDYSEFHFKIGVDFSCAINL